MEELTFICGIICNGDVKHFHALANNSFRLSIEYFHKGSAKWNELDCVDAVMSLWLYIQHVVTLSSSSVTRPISVYQLTTDVMARTTAETGPTNSTAVSHILIVLSTHMHMVQLMPLHPKPHHLLPRLNSDWLHLPGTGLPRLSWKKAVKRL